jgi:hypothetical protein
LHNVGQHLDELTVQVIAQLNTRWQERKECAAAGAAAVVVVVVVVDEEFFFV